MVEVFLLGGVRTPQGKYAGALSGVRPDDLAGLVVGEAVSRAGVPGDAVDEVVLGAANQAGEDNRDVARMAVLLGGLPDTVPGYTVNRLCASGLTAVISAAQAVRSGEADVIVAGGVESMTRAPWVMAKPGTPWAKPGEIADSSLGWRFTNPRFSEHDSGFETGPRTEADGPWTLSMGETAEEVAALDGIGRDECDEFALESHGRAVAAAKDGYFDDELVTVAVPRRKGDPVPVSTDEGPRSDASPESLRRLRPVFRRNGVVTAGNSSPLSDGAAALVVAGERAVREHGLRPLARVIAGAGAGVSPHLMGLGPVPATQKALSRAGWSVDDLDAVPAEQAPPGRRTSRPRHALRRRGTRRRHGGRAGLTSSARGAGRRGTHHGRAAEPRTRQPRTRERTP